MKKQLLFWACYCWMVLGYGQAHFSGGVRIDYTDPQFYGGMVDAEGTIFSFRKVYNEKPHYVLFTDIDFKVRWSSTVELGYLMDIGPAYSIRFPNGNVGGGTSELNIWDFKATINYELFSKFKLFAGAGVWYLPEPNPGELILLDTWHEIEAVREFRTKLNQSAIAGYQISETGQEWLMTATAGIRVEFWRLLLSFSFENSITPYGRYLDYQKQRYDFRQNAYRYLVGIGFKIFK